MNSQTIFANLRNILADLYPDEASTRRVVNDAGVDASRIALSSHAANNWHAILIEAEKTNQIDMLLDVALREYRANQVLRAARDDYHRLIEQGADPLINAIPPISIGESLTPAKRAVWMDMLKSTPIQILVAMAVVASVVLGYWLTMSNRCGSQLPDVYGYLNRATEHRDVGDYRCAIRDFNTGLRIATRGMERAQLYYGLATVALAQDEPEQALKYVDAGLNYNQNYPFLYLSRGLALCRLQRWPDSAQQLQKFVETETDSGIPLQDIDKLIAEIRANRDVSEDCYWSALNLK